MIRQYRRRGFVWSTRRDSVCFCLRRRQDRRMKARHGEKKLCGEPLHAERSALCVRFRRVAAKGEAERKKVKFFFQNPLLFSKMFAILCKLLLIVAAK